MPLGTGRTAGRPLDSGTISYYTLWYEIVLQEDVMQGKSRESLNRFNYLFGETEALYHEMAHKLGLSDSAMKILYTVCDTGEPCPLQEVCRRSGLSKQTVNSALRKLEREQVLYLETAGGRGKQVRLTESGRKLAESTVLRIIEIENAVFGAWATEDVQTYLALTERFLNDVKQRAAALDSCL